MNSSEFSPSEMIYLFLDGEHTAVERSVLFSALANNQELQTEFEDALKIRSSAALDALTMAPPASVTSSLMAKAGFAGATATHAVSQGWFSSLWSSYGATVLTYAVPAMMAVSGFALGGYVFSADDAILKEQLAAARSQSQEQQVSLTRLESAFSESQSLARGLQEEVATLNTNTIRQDETIRSLAGIIGSRLNAVAPTDASVQQSSDGGRVSEQTNMPATHSAQSSIATNMVDAEDGVSTVPPQAIPITTRPVHFDLPVITTSSQLSESHDDDDYQIEVSLRGMSGLYLTQQQLVSNGRNNLLANLGVGMAYRFSNSFSVTAEAGQETFPLFIAGTSGLYLRENLWWGTVGARYTIQPIRALWDIQPVMQVSGGFSGSGPLVRAFTGLAWQADSRVVFRAGVEGMQAMFNYTSGWESARKLNFTYSVAVGL